MSRRREVSVVPYALAGLAIFLVSAARAAPSATTAAVLTVAAMAAVALAVYLPNRGKSPEAGHRRHRTDGSRVTGKALLVSALCTTVVLVTARIVAEWSPLAAFAIIVLVSMALVPVAYAFRSK